MHHMMMFWTSFIINIPITSQYILQSQEEGTPDLWRGWSNGGKNQNPNKFLGPSTKLKKIPGPKLNPPQKNPMPNFRALKISRKP